MDPEKEGVRIVASLMALSARTAPKARGVDDLVIRMAEGPELSRLAGEMRKYGEETGTGFFVRDAGNIEKSDLCLILGWKGESVTGLDCGACGYQTCAMMLEAQKEASVMGSFFSGPNCAIRMTDLGIALGSAVKTASIHNVDNRVMYSAGVCALRLGWLEGCYVAYAIPISVSGKNIYFDRST